MPLTQKIPRPEPSVKSTAIYGASRLSVIRRLLSLTLKRPLSSVSPRAIKTNLKHFLTNSLRGHDFLYGNSRGSSSFILYVLVFIAAAGIFFYLKQRASAPDTAPTAAPKAVVQLDTPAKIEPVNATVLTQSADSDNVDISRAKNAADAGEYESAAGLLRVARIQYPESAKVTSLLTTVLNKDALKMMDSGRYAEAKNLLTEANGISPDPAITGNLAHAQIKLNDYKGAAKTLEPRVNDPEARKNLEWLYSEIAEKAYKENRLGEAVEFYEKLAVLKPHDAKLSNFLADLKKESDAEGQMGSTEGSHFTVKYDGAENAIAGHVIKIVLEEAYFKVGSDMQFYPDDRIEALLYTGERFRDVTGSPSWAGALFDGRIKVPAGGVTNKTALLEKVLFHEYTHAVVHRLSGGRAPVWLHEGLAQLAEGKSDSHYKNDLRSSAIAFKETHAVRNVLRVLEGSFMNLDSNQANSAYLLSLSATQYMTREFGVFSARKILENLRAGMSMDDAVQDALHLSYDDFFDTWLTSLTHR